MERHQNAQAVLEQLTGEGQFGVVLALSGQRMVRPVAWTGFDLDPGILWFTFDPGQVLSVLEKPERRNTDTSHWGWLGGHGALCAPIFHGNSPWGVVYLRDDERGRHNWPEEWQFTPSLPLPDGPDLSLDSIFLESVDDPRQDRAQAFLDGLHSETGDLGYLRFLLLTCDARGGNLRKLAASGVARPHARVRLGPGRCAPLDGGAYASEDLSLAEKLPESDYRHLVVGPTYQHPAYAGTFPRCPLTSFGCAMVNAWSDP